MKIFALIILQYLFATSAGGATFDFYESKIETKSAVPVIIYVHGGAWISGSKEQYSFVGESLSKEGFCVAVAGYSLAPKNKHPVPVDELNKIIADVSKKKMKACNVKQIYLVGHSAGAHMIAFWNTKYSSSAVKGFVGIEGIYDLVKLAQVWPGYKDWFLYSAFGKEKDWAGASPANLQAKNNAKWLLVHSKKDELVDRAQTENFLTVLKRQKIPSELLLLQNENHFGSIEAALQSKEFKKFAVLGL
ncbi:MAG: alpha/beta-hydrolase [Pseudobdellovibrio sp.]|jgi:acetyl esterase/lipase|nr:alpha/beta-hydrolase [Pseudobdellovibrio sp.]